MSSSRLRYRLLLWLLLPYVFVHLLWRARKQPEYLAHLPERFGFYRGRPGKPVIWLHTVSVGETRAVATLVGQLRTAYPGYQMLLTHTTPTGRAESERLYGADVQRVYLPYDYPSAVRRFIGWFRPAVGVLMETEVWPNLIHECRQARIPLLLLNARLSEKSARRYAHYPQLTHTALSELRGIAAQTREDAERLQQLGAKNVTVMGNLKFDIEPPAEMLERGKELRQQLGKERQVFLGASMREGEEELLLDMLGQLQVPGLLTVIVPRHPQRFEEVAALLRSRGINFVRRSEDRPVPENVTVVLGDSMGEMFAYYAACDVAFIGGSLLPFGGQNLIEACAVGKPVLIGPHTYNFQAASDLAVEQGAAIRVASSSELREHLQTLFAQPQRLAEMGHSGLKYARAEQGATGRALEFIVRLLGK